MLSTLAHFKAAIEAITATETGTIVGQAVKRLANGLVTIDALGVVNATTEDAAKALKEFGQQEAIPVDGGFTAVVSTNPATLLGYGTWQSLLTAPLGTFMWKRTA